MRRVARKRRAQRRRIDRAAELYEEAAVLAGQSGNKLRLAVILSNLGTIAGMRNDNETSARYAAESAELQRKLGDQDGLAVTLHNLGRARARARSISTRRAGALSREPRASRSSSVTAR